MKLFRQIICSMIIVLLVGTNPAVAENQWPYDPSPLYPFGAASPAQTDQEARIFDQFIRFTP